MWVTKQLLVHIDWEGNKYYGNCCGPAVDCLIFHVLQNSIYVQQKKETHSCLKLTLSKLWYKYKHYDRIDRQMTKFLFLMLKQQNTKREKLLHLTEKNYTVAIIGINLYSFIFIFVHSISWMLLLNMPIENKALFVLFVYYVYL